MEHLVEFDVHALLRPDGTFVEAGLRFREGRWASFAVGGRPIRPAPDAFFVPGLPVEVHCHGIGDVDFSDFEQIDLVRLERAARAEGVYCIPTLYLPHSRLDGFVAFMARFAAARRAGQVPSLLGIALEGPLLASFGGTPERGVWPPTRAEWERLAQCGPLGLEYVVLSPDAMTAGSYLLGHLGPEHPPLEWIVELLLAHGVRPALGHFHRHDPAASADAVERVLATGRAAGVRPFDGRIVTDHLFNDMPRLIAHAWRTPDERRHRRAELESYDLPSWRLDRLDEQVGPVPGAIMRAASDGWLIACLNFDGEHVDFEIARRAVELIGTRGVMAMTDRSDVARLGGQHLQRRPGNTLWYQHAGVVAAGSQQIDLHMSHMEALGFDDSEIWALVCGTPMRVFCPDGAGDEAPPAVGSLVSTGRREVVACVP